MERGVLVIFPSSAWVSCEGLTSRECFLWLIAVQQVPWRSPAVRGCAWVSREDRPARMLAVFCISLIDAVQVPWRSRAEVRRCRL